MILSRRKTHFYAAIALAVTLPIIFLAGLVGRPGTPILDGAADESLKELFATAQFPTDSLIPGDAEILADGDIQLRAIATQSSGQSILEIQPVAAIQAADILVYWQAGDLPTDQAANTDQATEDAAPISDTAVLLGQLSGDRFRRFPLPADSRGQTGHLILYSNGQSTEIATFPFTP